jgi:hypothetical protein
MSEMQVTLPNEETLGFTQAMTLADLVTEHGADKTHWHQNECRCCLTLHAPTGAYVIGPDGGADFFPGAHCGCGEHVTGYTDA